MWWRKRKKQAEPRPHSQVTAPSPTEFADHIRDLIGKTIEADDDGLAELFTYTRERLLKPESSRHSDGSRWTYRRSDDRIHVSISHTERPEFMNGTSAAVIDAYKQAMLDAGWNYVFVDRRSWPGTGRYLYITLEVNTKKFM